jgi:hypothetical protein
MASSCHIVNNWCCNCTKQSSNGIIRNSKFYCSENCYDRAQQVHKKEKTDHHHHKVHFGGISYAPSSISTYRPPTPRIEKQCNFCFDKFDINTRGIDYGPMWFCCQHHLNLANPRPKVMASPAYLPSPIHIAPQVLPHVMMQRMGGPFIGGPFIGGPFFSPF